MRTKLFVILIFMLFGTGSLGLAETWDRSGNPSGQRVVAEEKSAPKPAAKVDIYVTDW